MGRISDFDFEFSIAEICTRLVFLNFPVEKAEKFFDDYAAFAVSEKQVTPPISVRIEAGPLFIPLSPHGLQIKTSNQSGRIEFVSYHEKGWFDQKTRQGELILRPEGHPENFLRVLYGWRCLEQDALLLHASGVICKGQGFVFFGCSGSGKTTITRFSQGTTILSDDLVIIRAETSAPEGVRVFGVPFRGEFVEAPRMNASARLRGLYALAKDRQNQVVQMGEAESVAKLAACVPFVMTQPQIVSQVLELCKKINLLRPVAGLHFQMGPGFWSLIDE